MDKYFKEMEVAVTVCAADGTILDLNEASKRINQKPGTELVGSNVLDCHPEPARTKLADMLARRYTNVYTIEKEGRHKLIFQTPWYENGEFGGLVELSMVIPAPQDMPHYVRKPKNS